MKAIWTGSLSFGLINIPVKLYSGTNARQGIELNLLHKLDHSPIRYARVCRKDGKEIPWDEIVKGYQHEDGDYVVLSKQELDELSPEKTQTIDIQQFVESQDIDLRYFEKPYYLEPQKGGEKAYALLNRAFTDSGKLALARFVLHQKAHIAVVMPHGDSLVLEQMRFPTDVREPLDLNIPSKKEVEKSELDMALKLVKQETKPFIAEDIRDTYTEELEKAIENKTKGLKPRGGSKSPTKTKDLMAALKASLNQK